MRKLVAMGMMLALMLAAASPPLAQDAIADDGSVAATSLTVEVFDASQFQSADALQTNTGDATATADDDSTADASIDQSLQIDQFQLNGGFGDGIFIVF